MLHVHSLHYCSLCNTCADHITIFAVFLTKSLWPPRLLSFALFNRQVLLICSLSLAGVNCLAYDEAIIAQQDRIQQEVRNRETCWFPHSPPPSNRVIKSPDSSHFIHLSVHKTGSEFGVWSADRPGDSDATSSFLTSCKWSSVCLLLSSWQCLVLRNSALIRKLAKSWNVGWSKEGTWWWYQSLISSFTVS